MTERQERIIRSALQLFAEEGYTATSTKMVAQHAGVSEGLIFRHFSNKEGLLQAVINQGLERAAILFNDILAQTDPREVIRLTVSLPFNVPENEYDFWRLQFKLKWELKGFPSDHTQPLKTTLVRAFSSLGFDKPELEAEYLLAYMEGISASILKGHLTNKKGMLNLVLKKYHKLFI